jgi:hypothetical protein
MSMLLRLLAAAIVVLLPCRAFAWGSVAHRVVAQIAAADLPPDVAANVKQLLGRDSLVRVSTMPDDWSGDRSETRIWHFVDIPLRAPAYNRARDCRNSNDCLVGALQRFERVLADRSQSDEDRREALIYVVHLIADAHQPLHTADNNDSAGNKLTIRYRNATSNLHRYWDTTVLSTGETEADYARRLVAAARQRNAAQVQQVQRGNVESWVNESHGVAASIYAKLPGSRTIDSNYESWSRRTADEQLIKAGLRLRGLLVRYFSGADR